MNIAIITGGTSDERALALRSSENMRDWVIFAWHSVDLYDFPTGLDTFLTKYQTYDLVIPMFHGVYGEDGQITAFLRTLGCRYAYSDFEVHALCIDKNLTNIFIEKIGVNIPESFFVTQKSQVPAIDTYPLIVKPNKWGSSLGTSKVKNQDELIVSCEAITDDDTLIQECIEGREFTVGVYRDASGYHVLPIIEIRTLSQDFFDYSEKYETDGSNEVFMEWEAELQKRLSSESLLICEYTRTGWIVRIDWRYDGSDLYCLEVNTIPGFTSGSLVPKMWKKSGKTEGEFVEMLIG